jgi:uridine phosphorylase
MEPVIVEPKAFLDYLNKGIPPDISSIECVIFLYDKSLLNHIKRQFKPKKIQGFVSNYHLIEDKILICSGFGIGCPAAVDAMEGLIAAGATRFISIGTAGGISSQSKLDDIVVCTKALIDEGTSSHYIPGKKYSYPHKGLTVELYDLVQKEFKFTSRGSTWSTDAPFRETIQKLIAHQKKGIQTVDMEASALFTLGKYRNVEAASVFVIGDLLSSEGWHPGFLQKKVRTIYKHLVNTVIKYYLAEK